MYITSLTRSWQFTMVSLFTISAFPRSIRRYFKSLWWILSWSLTLSSSAWFNLLSIYYLVSTPPLVFTIQFWFVWYSLTFSRSFWTYFKHYSPFKGSNSLFVIFCKSFFCLWMMLAYSCSFLFSYTVNSILASLSEVSFPLHIRSSYCSFFCYFFARRRFYSLSLFCFKRFSVLSISFILSWTKTSCLLRFGWVGSDVSIWSYMEGFVS